MGILTTAVVLAAGTAACGDNGADDLPEPVPPQTDAPDQPPPSELTPEEQEAVDEVTALFDEFMAVYVDVLTAGDPGTDEVKARLPPLTHPSDRIVNDEIVYNYLEERRVEGGLTWELVEVAEVDLDRVVALPSGDVHEPLVRLRYCVDSTDWQTVDKNTGESVEPGEWRLIEQAGGPNLVMIELLYFDPSPIEPADNPRWHLGEWENQEGQPC